jgi:Uma2 family endonuclease
MPTTTIPEKSTMGGKQRSLLLPPMGVHTVQDWVTWERSQPVKHELHNGELIPMGGGTFEHNAVAMDIAVALTLALETVGSDCGVLGSDQKVFISERRGYYPDVLVVCGEPQIDFEEALRNPVAVVEVLSDSTEAFDRGEKFQNYRMLESLQHYLLVAPYRPTVEHFVRQDADAWMLSTYTSLADSLSLAFGDKTVSLSLSRIYRRIPF